MLVRYAFCVAGVEQDAVFKQLESIVTEERYKKMQKYRFPIDKIRSLFAEVLVRYALKKHFAMEGADIAIDTNEYGKPYLKDVENVYFNVSHSGDWVVCAVSDQPVGVDVEQIKKNSFEIADRFFSEKEAKAIQESEVGQELFYKYWTLKESYVKAEGKGMSIPFDSFAFTIDGEDISLEVEESPCDTYQFQVYKIDEGTFAATCSHERPSDVFEQVSIEQLEEILLKD